MIGHRGNSSNDRYGQRTKDSMNLPAALEEAHALIQTQAHQIEDLQRWLQNARRKNAELYERFNRDEDLIRRYIKSGGKVTQ